MRLFSLSYPMVFLRYVCHKLKEKFKLAQNQGQF